MNDRYKMIEVQSCKGFTLVKLFDVKELRCDGTFPLELQLEASSFMVEIFRCRTYTMPHHANTDAFNTQNKHIETHFATPTLSTSLLDRESLKP